MKQEDKITLLRNSLCKCTEYYRSTVPLCAAENVISDFSKLPLSGDFQERYIMGSAYSFNLESNFIGSQFLFPIYSMIHEECNVLFGKCFADARTLSGMNCLTTILMSLTKLNDKVAILPAAWGGHPSVQPVCERLGLEVHELPYDHEKWDINYSAANQLINDKKINYVLLAPSDIIHPLDVAQLNLDKCVLLYDVSQTMGLIAGGVSPNPINLKNTVLFGGTHKTIPGPASGLILTQNEDMYKKMDSKINPQYLRHTQMHQVASLLFSLIEVEFFGHEYATQILKTSNKLGELLEMNGFDVARIKRQYSETHQLFIFCDMQEMTRIFRNAIRYGVTLNKKEKALFRNSGIRLGTQEIARYGWDESAFLLICGILNELREKQPNRQRVIALKSQLPPKNLKFTFSNEIRQGIMDSLHQI